MYPVYSHKWDLWKIRYTDLTFTSKGQLPINPQLKKTFYEEKNVQESASLTLHNHKLGYYTDALDFIGP